MFYKGKVYKVTQSTIQIAEGDRYVIKNIDWHGPKIRLSKYSK